MKLFYFGENVWEENYIKERLPGIDILFRFGSAQEVTDSDSEAEIISVFVNSRITAAELDRFPKLKLIATRSTGFDHIDMEEVARRNIVVASVPTYGVATVAEFAFALLLILSRRVFEARQRVIETKSFSQTNLTGFDLQGKTIGIVGSGKIGQHVSKIANGFGMRVIAFDTQQDPALAQSYNFTYVGMDELLGGSDIITLHVPHNEYTHHLLNKENMPRIKKGAYLINTARGAVVETEALIEALKRDILAGVGTDVLEREMEMQSGNELSEENLFLINHPRVIVTPHIAFDTTEALQRILDTTTDNILSFKNGESKNLVQKK